MGEYGGKRVVETEAGKWAGMFKKIETGRETTGKHKAGIKSVHMLK